MDLNYIKALRLSDMEKKIFFLAWLNETLKAVGSSAIAVLVGGSGVQLYTGGNYASSDVDLVLDDISEAAGILEANSFSKTGKHYYSKDYCLFVDLIKGSAPERITIVEYSGKPVFVIPVEEMIIDRLAAAKKLNIPKDLEWARVMISWGSARELDMEYLRKRAEENDVMDFLKIALVENDRIMGDNIGSR